MKLTTYIIAGAVGALFVMNDASAQDTTAQNLTYDQAIQLAIDNSISLQQQKNTMKYYETARKQSYASFLPEAGIRFDGQQVVGRQFDETTAQFTSEKVQSLSGGLSASLPLFNGLSRYYTAQQTKSGVQQQVFQIERAKQDAVYNASVQYLEVLVNQELLEVAKADLKQQQELLTSIQAFMDAGIRNIADLYNQEAETKRVELTVVEAQNNLNNSKATLFSTIQIDPFAKWHFEQPNIEMAELLTRNVDIEGFYNEAIANRPDYKQQKQTIDYNEKSVKIAKSNYYPSLSAGYYFGSRYSSLAPQVFEEQFRTINRVQVYQLSLYIPIFSNLRNSTLVQQNLQEYNNSQLELENLERTVFTQAQTAISDFRTAQQRVITTQSQLKAAEKAQEVEQERFRLGTGTLIDLNKASATLVTAKSNKIQAEYTLIFQETALKYYKGNL